MIYDRVFVQSTTTGTGSYALGSAVSGFQSFATIPNGTQIHYTVENGVDWEVGLGTKTNTTLTRDTILASSNSNNAVSWSAGTKQVFHSPSADYFNDLEALIQQKINDLEFMDVGT